MATGNIMRVCTFLHIFAHALRPHVSFGIHDRHHFCISHLPRSFQEVMLYFLIDSKHPRKVCPLCNAMVHTRRSVCILSLCHSI